MASSARLAWAAVLGVAAVLRFASLGFGSGINARPDEDVVLETLAKLRAGSGDFLPIVLFYGGGYVLPLLGFTSAWRAVLGPGATAGVLAWDPEGMLLAARTFSALTGLATVAVVGAAATAAGGGQAAGLLAAAIVAVAPLAVREAHFAKADTAATLTAALLVWALCRHWMTARGRALGIGAAAACAAGTKAGAAMVPVAALALLVPAADAAATRRRLALAAVAFVALSVPLHYVWLQHPAASWLWMRTFVDLTTGDAVPDALPPLQHYAVIALRHGCGLAVVLLAAPALAWGLWRGGALRFTALATLVYWLALARGKIALARYLLPSLPGLAVVVGAFVVDGVRAVAAPGPARILAGAAATALLVAGPLGTSATLVRLLGRDDTRTLATAWVRDHLPADAVVATYGTQVGFGLTDPGRPDLGHRRVYGRLPVDRWDVVGVTHVIAHRYPVLRLSSEPVPEQGRPRLRRIATFDAQDGPVDGPVLEALDAVFLPLARFAGIARPGPTIDVYEVVRPAR